IRGGGRKWGRLWVSDPEAPKYGLIRGRNRAFRFLSSRVSDCGAADSRNFEENSNRDWLQAARKTPPKAVRRSPQGRIQVPSFAKLRSGRLLRLKWRAIRATLSRKGSTVPVLQALFGCVVSAVRASLIVQRWKPLWLSGDGKRGASLFGCSISGASGRRCCQTQGE